MAVMVSAQKSLPRLQKSRPEQIAHKETLEAANFSKKKRTSRMSRLASLKQIVKKPAQRQARRTIHHGSRDTPGLSHDWELHTDEDSGNKYYYNRKTGETRWVGAAEENRDEKTTTPIDKLVESSGSGTPGICESEDQNNPSTDKLTAKTKRTLSRRSAPPVHSSQEEYMPPV